MKTENLKKTLPILIGGFCFAVIILLLLISYIPGFAPLAYDNLRRTRLVMVVPIITACGLLASVGWLWIESKERDLKGKSDEM